MRAIWTGSTYPSFTQDHFDSDFWWSFGRWFWPDVPPERQQADPQEVLGLSMFEPDPNRIGARLNVLRWHCCLLAAIDPL